MKKKYVAMAAVIGAMSIMLTGCGSKDVYKEAYANAMTQDEVDTEDLTNMTDFALHDFDEDGTPELILCNYPEEADADGYREAVKACIYACDKKGELKLVKLDYTSDISYNQDNNTLLSESKSTDGNPLIAYAYKDGEFNSSSYLTMSDPILYNLTGNEDDTVSISATDSVEFNQTEIAEQIRGNKAQFEFYEINAENIQNVLGVAVTGLDASDSSAE